MNKSAWVLFAVIFVSLPAHARPKGRYLKIGGGFQRTAPGFFAASLTNVAVLAPGKTFPSLDAPSIEIAYGSLGKTFGIEVGGRYTGRMQWMADSSPTSLSDHFVDAYALGATVGLVIWIGPLYLKGAAGVQYQVEEMDYHYAMQPFQTTMPIFLAQVGLTLIPSLGMTVCGELSMGWWQVGGFITPVQF